ncbi:hypothetical protein P0L94_02995 [Microbacter sp. GSS18]|nr:hypothetical protein P0L94_02995 [Microbacter sp. GSS18]
MSEKTKDDMTAGDRIRGNPLVSTLLAVGAIVSVVLGFFQLRAWIWPDDDGDVAIFAAAEVGGFVSLEEFNAWQAGDTGDDPQSEGDESPAIASASFHLASAVTTAASAGVERSAVIEWDDGDPAPYTSEITVPVPVPVPLPEPEPEPEPTPEPDGEVPPAASGGFTVMEFGNTLNVRSLPQSGAPINDRLSGGTALSVVCVAVGAEVATADGDSNAHWYRISEPGGYVSAAFVDVSADAAPPEECTEIREIAKPSTHPNPNPNPNPPAPGPTATGEEMGREVTIKAELVGLRGRQVDLQWEIVRIEDALNGTGVYVLEPATENDRVSLTLWFPLLDDHPSYEVRFWLQDGADGSGLPYDETRVTVEADG